MNAIEKGQHTQNHNQNFMLYERWRESSLEAFIKNQFEAKSYRTTYEEKLPTLLSRWTQLKVVKLVANAAGRFLV